MELLPWFKGHTGKVEYNKEAERNESFGVVTKNNMNSYTVTELPIGMEYQKYVETLDKLEENGTIQDYDDKCDPKTDKILFEIKTTREFTRKHDSERKIYDALKLVKSLPETLCCIDENNRVREFSSVKEILDAFIDIRLKYYKTRKDHILKTLKADIEKLLSKYLFVEGIVKKTIVVSNRKKADVEAQLDKVQRIIRIDGSYDYLLALPIHQLTAEKLDELKKQIQDKKDLFKTTKETTVETMWTNDLHEFKKAL
jgi:DNA topoisomerase-2